MIGTNRYSSFVQYLYPQWTGLYEAIFISTVAYGPHLIHAIFIYLFWVGVGGVRVWELETSVWPGFWRKWGPLHLIKGYSKLGNFQPLWKCIFCVLRMINMTVHIG